MVSQFVPVHHIPAVVTVVVLYMSNRLASMPINNKLSYLKHVYITPKVMNPGSVVGYSPSYNLAIIVEIEQTLNASHNLQ